MNSIPLIEPESLAIQTQNLGKRFGTRAALEGVDLEIPRGAAFGFLGPNGAGKTTLIRLLLGLAEPSAGHMRLLGHELPDGHAAALARVGAIVEEPRLHPHLTGVRTSACTPPPASGARTSGSRKCSHPLPNAYTPSMTRAEAEAFASTQAREHPDRDTSRWMVKQRPDGSWIVVKVRMPPGMRVDPLSTTTEAKPEPPQPDDPRTSYDRGVGGPWVG